MKSESVYETPEGRLIPSLCEDVPFYSWIRPIELPRYFNSGLFYHEAETNVVSDSERDWHCVEYKNKVLGSVLPHKHYSGLKNSQLLDIDNAASLIQTWWRNLSKMMNASSRLSTINEQSFCLEVQTQKSSARKPGTETAEERKERRELILKGYSEDTLSSDFGINLCAMDATNDQSRASSHRSRVSQSSKNIQIDECSKVTTPKDSIHDFSAQVKAAEKQKKTAGNQANKSPYSFGYASNDTRSNIPSEFQPTAFQGETGAHLNRSSAKKYNMKALTESSNEPVPRDFSEIKPQTVASLRQSYTKESKPTPSLGELKSKLDESIRIETIRKSVDSSFDGNVECLENSILTKRLDFGSAVHEDSILTDTKVQVPLHEESSSKALANTSFNASIVYDNSHHKLDFKKKNSTTGRQMNNNNISIEDNNKHNKDNKNNTKKEVKQAGTKVKTSTKEKEIEVVMIEEQDNNNNKQTTKDNRKTSGKKSTGGTQSNTMGTLNKTAPGNDHIGTSSTVIPINRHLATTSNRKAVGRESKDSMGSKAEERCINHHSNKDKDRKVTQGSTLHSPK